MNPKEIKSTIVNAGINFAFKVFVLEIWDSRKIVVQLGYLKEYYENNMIRSSSNKKGKAYTKIISTTLLRQLQGH